MIFRVLLPEAVAVAEMDPREARVELLAAAEQACVARAVPRRQQEFAAGRLLARDLGVPPPLLVGRDRAPCWPAGVVGSITHCERLAAVAVMYGPGLLGIDVEPEGPLPDELRSSVLTPEERHLDPLAALITFSAKEAVYKAIHPRVRRLVEFHEVVVRLESGGRFIARTPLLQEHELPGRFGVTAGFVATAVCVQSSGESIGGGSPSTGTSGTGTNLGTVPGRKG